MPLFSTPIYIKEYVPILDKEIQYLKSHEYERMSSKNGDYTKDKYVLDNPELTDLM